MIIRKYKTVRIRNKHYQFLKQLKKQEGKTFRFVLSKIFEYYMDNHKRYLFNPDRWIYTVGHCEENKK